MGSGKSGSSGLVWILGIIFLVLLVPKEIWIVLGIAGAIALLVYAYIKIREHNSKVMGSRTAPPAAQTGVQDYPQPHQPTLAELMAQAQRGEKSKAPPPLPTSSPPPVAHATAPTPPVLPAAPAPGPRPSRPPSDEEHFYTARLGDPRPSTKTPHTVPAAPAGLGDGKWVPPGQSVSFAGTLLPDGMFYLGARLAGANGRTDPCLISGLPSIANRGDFRERQMNYWPSYVDISAAARRSYITWLSEGRSHPKCDLGFVFLFFYGLERRVIFDTPRDPTAKADWPAIAAELHRLLDIYGHSGSFRRYAGELLDWMELHGTTERLYTRPVPALPRSYELPRYLRLALGQSAVDRAPVPAVLALAWLRLNPDTYLRTAATRCPEEFERLFIERYHELLGPGLVLPKNRTKLKFVYQPASSAFHGVANPTLTFGDIPDPTALTAPIRTLMEIAEQCTDELGPFSRLVGKDPTARGTLDGLLQLPTSLWPAPARAKLTGIMDRMKDGMLTLSLAELIGQLGGATQPFTRERTRGLARSLEASQIGMEPNVLAGARNPDGDDPIVLFALPAGELASADSSAYQAAMLTLQLASAVAQADGDFNATEIAHLRAEIQNWSHLTPVHQVRLQAHLQWLTVAPVTLPSLKKKLEPLEQNAKETVAAFMATLAQADGMVSPAEMRFLEKVYKALGVEPKRVFSDVHAVSAGAPAKTSAPERTGFKLDAQRIAELQKDTERVSALLAGIFKEDEVPAPIPVAEEPPGLSEPSLMGLDAPHTAFLRLLLSRPQWSRSELEDAAADLDLMLDGALEQVNEASFDTYDLPFTDGEDPVDVNAEVVEKIEQ